MAQKQAKDQASVSFGDHGTFIVGGHRHGVGTAAGGARGRRWGSLIVGAATVIGTVFTVGAFWVGLDGDDSGADGRRTPSWLSAPGTLVPASVAPAATTTEPAPEATQAPAPAAAAVFDDVVTLDQKTGVELDHGAAKKLYKQDGSADLYLDWGFILYSSARHSALYDDGGAGDETGARDRCATYRLAGKQTTAHQYIGGGNQQYCFTTSDGHPGWFQVINTLDTGGLIVKAVVWAS